MYLGDHKLMEYKRPSIQGESPWISAGPLSKISSSNIVKVKSQKFHRLLLKLSQICSCFCHISLSSVSDSKEWRPVASSIPILVIRNAVWHHKSSPVGSCGALADNFSKMGTWTPGSLENPQQVGRNLNFLPLERKPLALRGVRSHYVGVMAAAKKGRTHHPLHRGPNPVWAHGARAACWFGRMISLRFLFQRVNLLWNHLLDRLVGTPKSRSEKQCVSTGLEGAGLLHTQLILWNCPMEKIWWESSALDCEG